MNTELTLQPSQRRAVIIFRGVDLTAIQNLNAILPAQYRFICTRLAVITNTVTTLTGGATIVAKELNPAGTTVQTIAASAALANTDAANKQQTLTLAANAMVGGNTVSVQVTAGSTATAHTGDVLAVFDLL